MNKEKLKECCMEECMKEDKIPTIERKIGKIYEKLLDIEEELEGYRLYKKKQELEAKEKRVKEEIYEVEHRENSVYERRKAKEDYFNDRF